MKTIISTFSFLLLFLSGQSQTNIVFIESDDQSNQTVGAFDNPQMKTPNIDKLVKEGVSFTSAYNMGCWSPAVCVPSRTMLFYGKYLWDSKKINRQNAPESFPEKLKQHGYNTYMTGKWHAWGKKPEEIFDKLGSIQPGQLETYWTPKGHVTDITGNEAVNYIKEYKKEDPFFLYVAFNAPHVPRETKSHYYDLYPTEEITLPPNVKEGPLNPNIEYNYTSAPLKKGAMRSRVQQNNAMITHMDKRIGDILNALKAKGIYEETIIVFTSDHGINFGENGVAGKVCLYEPSVTAPLIIKAPNFAKNIEIKSRVYLQDISPTLFDLLNITKPEKTDFKSLVPLVKNTSTPRESIYLAMFDDQRGIINKNQKLILYPKSGDIELYDLNTDPWETNNLQSNTNSKRIVKKLMTELVTWQKKVGDTVNIEKAFSNYFK
ncbi:Arylsulfatase A [Salegentibacter agarivorans]|uniref:Arylsulfatase A n=1 Tax=Salegentibacter agarivorans TaxID=345907 RepID=A0A1I2KP24_9FLAO|nr:sulfatase-like hydrolase/transferase [Salegentibacter agarivorans]SFF68088.1 Arylsulfatase A [Salegentibacter agarivorans]